MSIVQLKRELARLDKRGRQEILAYLLRLKHQTPQWRRSAASRLRRMKNGVGVTLKELEAKLAAR